MKPVGIIVHSTGANNKTIKRYVQPDDGYIGVNRYGNDWNHPNIAKCVHAFIGTDKDGNVQVYNTLPYDVKPWGCGKGTKGSYNNSYIQFEICEDDLKNEEYFNKCFELASEYCAYLMKLYPDITLDNVISHHEAHDRGYASNHGDCDKWLKKFGKDMDWFREKVNYYYNAKSHTTVVPNKTTKVVRLKATMYVRNGAGVSYKAISTVHSGDEYEIGAILNNWAYLPAKKGYISLNTKYTEVI